MIITNFPHQYIDRNTRQIVTEQPIGDRCIQYLYNTMRENAPALFHALTSNRMSNLLSYFHFDMVGRRGCKGADIFQKIQADPHECVEPLSFYDSYRKVFERQIRYWHNRPMNRDPKTIVSPADAKVLIGSLAETSSLFIKNKFFDLDELLGNNSPYCDRFRGGDFAVFRLTPDKYHYNHVPVTGQVVAIYQLEGHFHSCNPAASISIASLYSKNRRVVTVINTDIEGGTNCGMVAMVEVVALMIGDVVQAYSEEQYKSPRNIRAGTLLQRGCPKSLYRPGSSTDVLIFEPGRVRFKGDLIENSRRADVKSRFSTSFGRPLVETDIPVRSALAESVHATSYKGIKYYE
mgnify:CR=1 FL=1